MKGGENMRNLVLILLAVVLILCVGCGQKEEEEVNLPQQKPAVGQEVPVAPDLHKEEKKKAEWNTGNKKLDDFMNEDFKETKPIKITGFK